MSPKYGAVVPCLVITDCCACDGRSQVIGRSKEVTRVIQILARKRKSNPLLLGEPGVGKTAIGEGLAAAIVNNVQVRKNSGCDSGGRDTDLVSGWYEVVGLANFG